MKKSIAEERSGKKIVVICGSGSIAKRHSEVVREVVPEALICGLCPSNPNFYKSCDVILNDWSDLGGASIYLLIIANMPDQRLEVYKKLSRIAPEYILVEKPIVDASMDLSTVRDWLLTTSAPITIGYNLRHTPAYQFFADTIGSGILGSISTAFFYCGSNIDSWRTGDRFDENVASKSLGVDFELSHELAGIIDLFGAPRVDFCDLRSTGFCGAGVFDSLQGCVSIRAEELNLSVLLSLDFFSIHKRRLWVVNGENGSIEWNLLAGRVELALKVSNKMEQRVFLDDSGLSRSYSVQLKSLLQSERSNQREIKLGCEAIDLALQFRNWVGASASKF